MFAWSHIWHQTSHQQTQGWPWPTVRKCSLLNTPTERHIWLNSLTFAWTNISMTAYHLFLTQNTSVLWRHIFILLYVCTTVQSCTCLLYTTIIVFEFDLKMQCFIIYFNTINMIKLQAHSKQKDFSLKSKSVKSLKCVFSSNFEPF